MVRQFLLRKKLAKKRSSSSYTAKRAKRADKVAAYKEQQSALRSKQNNTENSSQV